MKFILAWKWSLQVEILSHTGKFYIRPGKLVFFTMVRGWIRIASKNQKGGVKKPHVRIAAAKKKKKIFLFWTRFKL